MTEQADVSGKPVADVIYGELVWRDGCRPAKLTSKPLPLYAAAVPVTQPIAWVAGNQSGSSGDWVELRYVHGDAAKFKIGDAVYAASVPDALASKCIVDPFSSRMCQRGTKSCNVDHTPVSEAPTPEEPSTAMIRSIEKWLRLIAVLPSDAKYWSNGMFAIDCINAADVLAHLPTLKDNKHEN